jgi:hypothetical protein
MARVSACGSTWGARMSDGRSVAQRSTCARVLTARASPRRHPATCGRWALRFFLPLCIARFFRSTRGKQSSSGDPRASHRPPPGHTWTYPDRESSFWQAFALSGSLTLETCSPDSGTSHRPAAQTIDHPAKIGHGQHLLMA